MPTPHEQESASYRLLDRGRDIGAANVSLTWSGDVVEAVASVETFGGEFLLRTTDPQSYQVRILFDAATGEALEIHAENYTWYPWGLQRVIPHPLYAFVTNYTSILGLGHPAIPFGAQVGLLAAERPPDGAWVAWGEGEAAWTSDPDGWTASGRGLCQVDCSFDGLDEQVFEWTLEGDGPGVLPTKATLDILDAPERLVMLRTFHETRGEPVEDFTPLAPTAANVPEGTGPCGFAPCESDAWPQTMSFQRGLEGLMVSPEWLAWSAGRDGIFPVDQAVFFSEGGITFVSTVTVETVAWAFTFGDSDLNQAFFFMTAARLGDDTTTLPVVETMSTGELSPIFGSTIQAWDEPMLLLGDVVEGLLQRATTDAGVLVGLVARYAPQGHSPDPRGNLELVLYVDDASGQREEYVVGSLKTGDAHVIVPGL